MAKFPFKILIVGFYHKTPIRKGFTKKCKVGNSIGNKSDQVSLGTHKKKAIQMDPSPSLSTLDPIEEKIMFDMDDNWDSYFCKCIDMALELW